jgi:hypothetical protein
MQKTVAKTKIPKLDVGLAGWFPVASVLMIDESFQALPIPAKMLFFDLVSEFNYRGQSFFRPDAYFSTRYRVSSRTIRRARKELVRLQLIRVKRGGLVKRDKRMATQYLAIRHASPDDCSATPAHGKYAEMLRFTFWYLTEELGTEAGWLYLILTWWKNVHKRENGKKRFFIMKRELCRLAGSTPQRALDKLAGLRFRTGDSLIQYEAKHHRILIQHLTTLADPGKDENNAKVAAERVELISKRMAEARRRENMVTRTKKRSLC